MAAGQRRQRVDLGERVSAEPQAEAGQGHAGDQDVEPEPGGPRDERPADPVAERRHVVGEQRDGSGAAAGTGVLVAVHGGADRTEPGERVGVADRESHEVSGEPVALGVRGARAALGDGDERAGRDALAFVAALVQPAAQGAGDDRDEDVVDGAAGGLADVVHVVEVDGHARDPAGAGGLGGERGRGAHVEGGQRRGGTDVQRAARVGQGVAQPVGQRAHVRHPSARRPLGAGPGCGQVHRVEDPGGEGQGAQPVGQGVVELEEHGEGPAVDARQYVRLPGRPVALQGTLHEAPGPGVEVGGRGVQPHVVERVEPGVGLAGGPAERVGPPQGQRRLPGVLDPHPQSGHRGGTGR